MKMCPTGCGREVHENLLCLTCWRLIPAPLQRDVLIALRRYQRQGALGLRTREDCQALIDARKRAIASARERAIKRELWA